MSGKSDQALIQIRCAEQTKKEFKKFVANGEFNSYEEAINFICSNEKEILKIHLALKGGVI